MIGTQSESYFSTLSWPSKGTNPNPALKSTYNIVNAHTGAYAALFSDTDGLEIVNMTPNLRDSANKGSEVNKVSLPARYDLYLTAQ